MGGYKSNCSATSLSYTRTALLAPSSLVLNDASPGDGYRVSLTVSGGSVASGKNVKIYSDSSCTSGNFLYTSSTYGASKTLTFGDFAPSSSTDFYATVYDNGAESTCLTATVNYGRNALNPPSSMSLNVSTPSPGESNFANIDFIGLVPGMYVDIFSDSNCTTKIEYTTASFTTQKIKVNGLNDSGVAVTMYSQLRDGWGYKSACSTANVSYTYQAYYTAKMTVQDWYPKGIAKGDFNNDGHLDIASTSGSGIDSYLGVGDGTFSSHQYFSDADGISSAASIDIGDINEDGFDDIVIGNRETINYFESNGNGTFKSAVMEVSEIWNFTLLKVNKKI